MSETPTKSLCENEAMGCNNEATVSVGHEGKWHLCDRCAALPHFKRYRVRKPLKKGAPR